MGAFTEAGNQVISGAILGMYLSAREIMAESLIECPIETGTLRSSARIEPLVSDGEKVSVTMGYGYGEEVNPITGHLVSEYAVPVHEILSARHVPPTKAKFLEDPALEVAPRLGLNMEVTIRRITLSKGTGLIDNLEEVVFPVDGEISDIPLDTLMTNG